MIVRIEEAKPIHAYEVVRNLREYERMSLGRFKDPVTAVIEAMRKSTKAFVGLIDGEIACLWGMETRTILSDTAYLWMITTNAVAEHPFVFVRHSQRMAQTILAECGTIEGYVFADNAMSAKWLKWLGADLRDLAIEGALEFRLRKSNG